MVSNTGIIKFHDLMDDQHLRIKSLKGRKKTHIIVLERCRIIVGYCKNLSVERATFHVGKTKILTPQNKTVFESLIVYTKVFLNIFSFVLQKHRFNVRSLYFSRSNFICSLFLYFCFYFCFQCLKGESQGNRVYRSTDFQLLELKP